MDRNENIRIKKINKVLWIIIVFTVTFNIIFLMRYNFEADSAFIVTLAQEQIRTGSLFPEGMFYSTGMFILSPNLLVIPFLFLTDNLVLARQLAILFLWAVVYFLLFKVFVVKNERNVVAFILASSFFSVFYIDASVVSMHFYQGAYVTYIIFLLLFLALMNKIIVENFSCKTSFVFVFFLYILANLGDIRNLLIWGIPGLVAYVLYIYFANGKQVSFTYSLLINQKLIRVLFNGMLLAFIVSVVISKTYGTGGSTAGTIAMEAKYFGNSLYAIITGIFNLYGNSYEAPLFSGGGVLKFVNLIVTVIVNVLLPVIAVKNYSKFELQSSKFIVLFSLCSNFIYLLVTFFTGAGIVEDRYLIPVYNNNILLFAVTGSFVLKKYLKNYKRLGLCCVLLYVLLNNFIFFYYQKESFANQKFGTFAQGVEGVVEFLEDKGLNYGYATFFNAEEYTVLSNNKVKIRGIRFEDGKIMPYNWLTSSHFYEPNTHTGKTFLMITDEELKYYFPKGISLLNFGKPIDTFKFKKYFIFVYDYNIAKNFIKGKKVYYLIRGEKSGIYIGNN